MLWRFAFYYLAERFEALLRGARVTGAALDFLLAVRRCGSVLVEA